MKILERRGIRRIKVIVLISPEINQCGRFDCMLGYFLLHFRFLSEVLLFLFIGYLVQFNLQCSPADPPTSSGSYQSAWNKLLVQIASSDYLN